MLNKNNKNVLIKNVTKT